MIPATTLTQLKAAPSSEKIWLCEISAGEQLAAIWTAGSGNAWTLPFGRDIIPLPGGTGYPLIEEVSGISVNGAAFAAATAGTVGTTNNSYYHDLAAGLLYVNFGGLNPNTATAIEMVMAWFPLRFATRGLSLDTGAGDRFFHPFLQLAPAVGAMAGQALGGRITMQSGDVTLAATSGLFDPILHTYVWENRPITIRAGGDALPYAEYAVIFTGAIKSKTWRRNAVTFSVVSKDKRLLDTMPSATFTLTAWPNMDPNIQGRVIPYAWGLFGFDDAIPAYPVDEVAQIASNTVRFKVFNHSYSGLSIWVSYDGGVTKTSCASSASNPPSAANQYYAGATELAAGELYVRFNASSYDPATGKRPLVFAACTGRQGGGVPIQFGPDIYEDIMLNHAGYVPADINAAELAASRAESEAPMNLYLPSPRPMVEVIEEITRSDYAWARMDRFGLFVYHTFAPSRDFGSPELTDLDLLGDIEAPYRDEDLFTKVRVGYRRRNTGNRDYLFAEAASTASAAKYGTAASKLILSCLRYEADAAQLAQRQLMMGSSPKALVQGRCALQLADKQAGDRICITTARAPYTGGKFTRMIVELVKIRREGGVTSFSGFALGRDISGQNVCILTADAAADYDAAPEPERQTNGYLADDFGFVSPGNPATKNISQLW